MRGHLTLAAAVLAIAATAAPAQALAAGAVGAALAGQAVGLWCAALAGATVLRAAAGYMTTIGAARCAACLHAELRGRFAAVLIAQAPHRHGDLASAVAGRLQAVRSIAEVAGLALGAAIVLACVDLRLLAPWLAAGLAISVLARRNRGAFAAARAARLAAAAEERRQALLAAAPLLGDLGLAKEAVRLDRLADLPMRQAEAACRQPAAAVQLVAGAAQTLVSVLAVLLAGDGEISVGAAIAAILVTTTAAARCELLAGAAQGHAAWTLALRRLRRLPAPVEPAVAVVGGQDRLFAGTLRRNLDPAGRHDDAGLAAALTRAGFPEAGARLDQELGAGGGGVSAGETFRLALARAVLAAPRTLILIDPLRHLDGATAARIRALDAA